MAKLIAIAVLTGVIAAGGCGDDGSPSTGSSGTTTGSPSDSQEATEDRSALDRATANHEDDSGGVLQGRKGVPAPGGGTFYAPIKPREYEVAAPMSCARTDSGELRPSRPGLRATRVGSERIRVRVLLGKASKQCVPRFVRLAFDVNDDPGPPAPPKSGPLIPVKRFNPWLEVELLENVVEADVVSASGVMSDGESGDSARVLIAGP